MNNTKKRTIYLVHSALIAAIYVALTYAFAPVSYGMIQLRFAEALTILPLLTPAAIPGLTIGCIIANLSSPYGLVDIICGSLATLLAAICTRMTRNIRIKNFPLLSFTFPVIFNTVIVGLELSYFINNGEIFKEIWVFFSSIAVSEALVCFVLGAPLYFGLKRTKIFER